MKLLNIKKSENIIENSNDGSYLPVDGTYEVAAGIKVTAKNTDTTGQVPDFLAPDLAQVLEVDFLPARIGSADDNDIMLPGVPGFFQYHALIKRNPLTETELLISPLNSKAALYINNSPVICEAELRENDVITAGGWDITVKEIVKSNVIIVRKKTKKMKEDFIPTLSFPFILVIMIIFAGVGLMFAEPLAILLNSTNKPVNMVKSDQLVKVYTSYDVVNITDRLGLRTTEAKNIRIKKDEATISEQAVEGIVGALKSKTMATPKALLPGIDIVAINNKTKRKISLEQLCASISKATKDSKNPPALMPIMTDYVSGKTRASVGNGIPINVLSSLALAVTIIRLPDYVNNIKVSPSKINVDETKAVRSAIADSIGLKDNEMQLYINCPVTKVSDLWNLEYRETGNDNIQMLMAWLENKWISNYKLEKSVQHISEITSKETNDNDANRKKRKIKKSLFTLKPPVMNEKKIKLVKTRGAKIISKCGVFSPNEIGDKYRRFHQMYEGLYAGDDEQFYINLDLHKYIGKWSEVALKTWLVNQTDGTVTPLSLTYDIQKVTENPQIIAIEIPATSLTNDFISVSFDIYGSTDAQGIPVDPAKNWLETINTEKYGLVKVKEGSRP